MVLVPDREALTGFVMLLVPAAVLCQGTEQHFPPTSQDCCMILCRAGQGTGEKGTGEPPLPDFREMGKESCCHRQHSSQGTARLSQGAAGHSSRGWATHGHQQGQGWVCVTIPGAGCCGGATWHSPGWEWVCAPRGVAKAQLLGDATRASRGETRFSTLTPSLIVRSYTGAYARNQLKHIDPCVQKIALCQRSGQCLQKELGGSSPVHRGLCWQQSAASPCKQPVMTLGSAKGFLKSMQD